MCSTNKSNGAGKYFSNIRKGKTNDSWKDNNNSDDDDDDATVEADDCCPPSKKPAKQPPPKTCIPVSMVKCLPSVSETTKKQLPEKVQRVIRIMKGDPGPPGKDGRDGLDGRDGCDGKNGINGRDGRDGKEAKPGKDGRDGEVRSVACTVCCGCGIPPTPAPAPPPAAPPPVKTCPPLTESKVKCIIEEFIRNNSNMFGCQQQQQQQQPQMQQMPPMLMPIPQMLPPPPIYYPPPTLYPQYTMQPSIAAIIDTSCSNGGGGGGTAGLDSAHGFFTFSPTTKTSLEKGSYVPWTHVNARRIAINPSNNTEILLTTIDGNPGVFEINYTAIPNKPCNFVLQFGATQGFNPLFLTNGAGSNEFNEPFIPVTGVAILELPSGTPIKLLLANFTGQTAGPPVFGGSNQTAGGGAGGSPSSGVNIVIKQIGLATTT